MTLPHRRHLLHLAAGAAALPFAPRIALAQSYPSRPVRIIVGYAAGGGVDVTARLIGQWLSERLGQQFIIENRPGAGTNIATEAVAKAAPDGYTLLLATAANAINATLYANLNFDFMHDIAPVGSIIRDALVMVVNPSLRVKSVPEFVAYAKANPGEVNFASGGVGGPDHVSGELFKMMTGASMTHVPYRGLAPALTDLMGGQVQVIFSTLPAAIEYIKAGRLRALAVTTAARSEFLPDVPLVNDVAPGFEASGWNGIGVPKNVSVEIVDRLNKEINAGLADPKTKARLADMGTTPFINSPADFGKFIADETEKWAKVVKFANIKPE